MSATAELVLAHLRALVACDTQNPPRDPKGVGALYAHVEPVLRTAGFSVAVHDLGDGCMTLEAVRGAPDTTYNFHVDTVPAAEGWRASPHALRVEGGRAVGLGACDIKGALASFLVAAAHTTGGARLLLTSDEEAGQSRCVRTWCAERDLEGALVVVAEPTQAKVVTAHRGIGTAAGTFHGTAGHASAARALTDSANHAAVRWAARALAYAEAALDDDAQARGGAMAGLEGLRFNLGILEGGIKANMIAQSCRVRFGVRPPPGRPSREVVETLCALSPEGRATWEFGYLAPPLPAPRSGRSVEAAAQAAQQWAAQHGLPLSAPVDFFTEAALFSEAGATALVYGPGDIAVAHAPEEWVDVSQLVEVSDVYRRLLAGAGAP